MCSLLKVPCTPWFHHLKSQIGRLTSATPFSSSAFLSQRYTLIYLSQYYSCSRNVFLINREKRKYEISYVCGPGSTPLLGLTIGQLLQSTADKYGDREAVVVVHQKIRKTYQQLLTDVSIES